MNNVESRLGVSDFGWPGVPCLDDDCQAGFVNIDDQDVFVRIRSNVDPLVCYWSRAVVIGNYPGWVKRGICWIECSCGTNVF